MNGKKIWLALMVCVILGAAREGVNAQAIAVSEMNYKATSADRKITGFIEGASFLSERGKYAVRAGKGELKNDKGEVLATGQLETVDALIAIKASKGSRFEFDPTPESVHIKEWDAEKPKTKGVLTLTAANQWTVESDDFYFLMKSTGPFNPVLQVLVAESILRSSVVKLPKGDTQLFGFKVNAPTEGAEVTFEHGKITAHSECAVQAIEKKKE